MGILLKGGRSFYNPPTSHLHDDAVLLLRPRLRPETFLCKLEFLLFKLPWDYQMYTNEKNRMTSLCKWAITCTSKDKHGDLSKFLFSQA